MNNRIGFWYRLGSYLLDFLIVMIIIYTIELSGISNYLSGLGIIFGEKTLLRIDEVTISSNSNGRILVFIIYGLFELFFYASPAKFLLGLTIAAESGMNAGILYLAQRYFVKNFPYLITLLSNQFSETLMNILIIFFGILFISGCLMALQKQRQALHDIISKTAVFRRKDLIINK